MICLKAKTTIKIDGKKYNFNRVSKKDVLIDNYVFSIKENDIMSVAWIEDAIDGESFLIVAIDDVVLQRKAEMFLGLNKKDVGVDDFNGAFVMSSLTKKGIKKLIKFIKDTIEYLNRFRN